MHCPFCNAPDSKVIDSRLAAEGGQIRRRRECVGCGERFTTFESYEVVMPRVIKSNGKNEPFDELKLRRSLLHALQKRPVTQDQIEAVLSDIQLQIRRLGERDVNSRTIGEIVMQSLFALDHVAYVRFASVYQDFQDIDAFRRHIESMQHENNK
ncbi:transcriptional regulator NrdR [Acinetobacter sp. MD2(2019)]|uniref:transcriptional regulator NrdR n=1 Tax=Acinetobacter sp. MD2(2019) TaxID=2605273 RepID=UPI002D1F387B|nr:transcriptional regulator NrdR [Acinetobacter sp. MD2(2019)]MEB3753301.1 transcriptional repressor NrdR [Acinetobacter sp. MD2(2019)]